MEYKPYNPLPNHKNFKCTVSYVGTRYYGFQKTRMGPSIEEELQKALEQIVRHPIAIQTASRTDRGVHAKGAVFNFFSDCSFSPKRLLHSLQCLLPSDITPLHLEMASKSFHPTLDSMGKEYVYCICNQTTQLPFDREFSWHIHTPLNLVLMEKAAQILVGKHDFSAFTSIQYENPVRIISQISFHPEKGHMEIAVQGNNFLYRMVRGIVGTLVDIGKSKIPLDRLPKILKSKDRRQAGVTAPAHGLFLNRVFY